MACAELNRGRVELGTDVARRKARTARAKEGEAESREDLEGWGRGAMVDLSSAGE